MAEKTDQYMEQLRDGMEWALKFAEKNGATSAEAFGMTLRLIKLMKMGERPTFSSGILRGFSFRVVVNGSIGFTFVPTVERKELEQAIKNAINQARATNQQLGDYSFPSALPKSSPSHPFDSELHNASPEIIAEMYERVALSKEDPRLPRDMKPLGGGTIFFSSESLLINTSGIDIEMKDAYYLLGAYFLSLKGFPAMNGHFEGSHYLKEIDPDAVIDKAISKTQEVAAPKTLNRQGSFPVIFHPDVLGISFFGSLLSLIIEPFKGDNVHQGKSPYSKDDIDEVVAAPSFTLVDDPWRPNMMKTMIFDGEGVPTRQTPIIEKGALKDFYLDSLHARRLNMANNAKSVRFGDDFGATATMTPPRIGSTNTIIKGGDASLEEIISETKEGFMINSVMGVHMSDFSSGRFSVGATGWYIKNGEIKFPVQELTVSGLMPQALKDIDLVSKEQESGVSAIVPYVRVSSLNCIAVKRPLFIRLGFKIYKILLRLGIVKHPLLS